MLDPFVTGTALLAVGEIDAARRDLHTTLSRLTAPAPPQEPEPEERTFINALDHISPPTEEWDDYIGQDALKERLRIAICSAKARGKPLDHVLLASGFPGVGKTKMARLIAHEMGGNIVELVPRFTTENLIAAAESLDDGDILFIDEIHKLAETGKRGAEVLLKLLEEGVIFLDGEAIKIANITVIGATTDVDMLPEPVLDRFKVKPYFERYSTGDLALITTQFLSRCDYPVSVADDMDLIYGIAEACRFTPRVCEEFSMAARDLLVVKGRKPTIDEVLEFQQVEPNGMTRQHIQYLRTMIYQGRRTMKDGSVDYIAGEALMMSVLRETKNGVQRVERYLAELGYLERTPSGRRLTDDGIDAAFYYDRK